MSHASIGRQLNRSGLIQCPLVRDKGEPNDWRAIRSEGRVPKNGNRIRVTAQLIYAQDGADLWAEHCDRIKLCGRVSDQGARPGTNFTRSSEPASWMA